MKIQKRTIIGGVLLGLVLQIACFAQQDASANANGNDITAPTQAPAALQGEAPVVLPAEAEHASQITGGIGFSGLYDDNAASTSSNRFGDSEYSILPEIGVQIFQPHTAWNLHYDGGYTFDQRASVRDSMTHEGLFDVQHQFSPRLATELREDYLISTDPFVNPGAGGTLPTFQGLGQLNTFTTTPLAQRTASISYATLSYQLTQHSSMGVSGNFSVEHYRDIAGSAFNASLINSTTTSGRAYYARQISERQTIGTEYQLQNLQFAHGISHTVDHTFFLFDQYALNPTMTLSVFGGPEYSHTHELSGLGLGLTGFGTPIATNQLSFSGGGTYQWSGRHNGLVMSALRSVTDGGGLLGATRLNRGDVEFRHAFSAHFRSVVGGAYADGRSLGSVFNLSGSRITTEQGDVGFEREFAKDIVMGIQYARIQQPHSGVFNFGESINHNRVEMTLRYRFARPISQ